MVVFEVPYLSIKSAHRPGLYHDMSDDAGRVDHTILASLDMD